MSSLTNKGSTHTWRRIREQILQRDQHTCQYCGQEANTVDHIIPRKHGGDDDPQNLVACCNKCNMAKGGRFFDEPKTLRTVPGAFTPDNVRVQHYAGHDGHEMGLNG